MIIPGRFSPLQAEARQRDRATVGYLRLFSEKGILLQARGGDEEITKLLMHQYPTPTSFEKYAPRVYRYRSHRFVVVVVVGRELCNAKWTKKRKGRSVSLLEPSVRSFVLSPVTRRWLNECSEKLNYSPKKTDTESPPRQPSSNYRLLSSLILIPSCVTRSAADQSLMFEKLYRTGILNVYCNNYVL